MDRIINHYRNLQEKTQSLNAAQWVLAFLVTEASLIVVFTVALFVQLSR